MGQAQLLELADVALERQGLAPERGGEVGCAHARALRERTDLAEEERRALDERLDRWDAARGAPWTRKILRLIAERPAVRAPDLAASLGRETLPFKRDVRKLKELGLTHSLPVGYEISVRGRAYLG